MQLLYLLGIVLIWWSPPVAPRRVVPRSDWARDALKLVHLA
jgi:hypothetical protein